MIEFLVHLLRSAGIDFGFFRLAEFISFRVLIAALTAMIFEVIFGHRIILWLYRRFLDTGAAYSSIEVEGKKGTPTSGGVMIVLSVFVSLFLWARPTPFVIAPALMLLAGALVGYLDDSLKSRFKTSIEGLDRKAKSILQFLFIMPFSVWLVSDWSPLPASLRTTFTFPYFRNLTWDAGPWIFGAFVFIAIYAIVNGVNLTDGKDGLASGPAIMTAGLYAIFAYILGSSRVATSLLFTPIPGATELAVFSAALVGGLAGFLWFNAYPAEVFMGDTGSLATGAAIGSIAFLTRQEMLFLIVGGVFVSSSFTSLVQILADKHLQRRVFIRGPLHDSWPQRGIAEPKGVIRYWLVSMILMIIAALSLKLR